MVLVVAFFAAACGSTGGPLASEDSDEFPSRLQRDWKTNFDKASVSPSELIQGQTKDGIAAIGNPRFLSVENVGFLGNDEPVIALVVDGQAKAYPLQILMWHEIVNDEIAGRPVLVTFCPLCNTAITFEREVNGETLEFGVSGFLRNSDLVMFDRQTESWWQQITGEAIVGDFTGTQLTILPSTIVAWSDFLRSFPEGQVLSQNTGFERPYGVNPYVGYDDINSSPFLFDGETDGRLAPMDRVVTVELNGETVAYPFRVLELEPVIADSVGGRPVVVFHKLGTNSALDAGRIRDARDVGSAAVFSPELDGRQLSFRSVDEAFIDDQTGSTWNILGEAMAGPLEGSRLTPVVSGNHFWFAWAAFKPETRIWTMDDL